MLDIVSLKTTKVKIKDENKKNTFKISLIHLKKRGK
jgi:hypothetical protein